MCIFFLVISIPGLLLASYFLLVARLILVHRPRALASRKLLDRVASDIAASGKLSLEPVHSISILPLVEYFAVDGSLKTEPGVSYLLKSDDDRRLLFDVGWNRKKEHPSPLLYNSRALDVDVSSDVHGLFVSHNHFDHVGGFIQQMLGKISITSGSFSFQQSRIPTFVPTEKSSSAKMFQFICSRLPSLLSKVSSEGKDEIVFPACSIGIIPASLFFIGYVEEQALVVDVKDKGLVVICGCGHQTLSRILSRTKLLFAGKKIYGFVGGIHLPVNGGRSQFLFGRINPQNVFATDRVPSPLLRDTLNEADVDDAIGALVAEGVQHVALSPHDSSDWALNRFRTKLGNEMFSVLKVGETVVI